MCPPTASRCLLIGSIVVVAGGAQPEPTTPAPPRRHVLTIEGENIVTFLPVVGLRPSQVEYQARIEYLVKTRTRLDDEATSENTSKKKTRSKAKRPADKTRKQRNDAASALVASAVDVAIHGTEMEFRQNGQVVVQSRISRARFQGRFLPTNPVLSVSYRDAPPALQELLKRFDSTAASVFLDDRANVVRRVVRIEGPLHAVTETILSIHTPIPTDAAFWEAPTQLAMGHGQTAKGMLRFQKEKGSITQPGGLVKVKVSGVLKAEGAIVGNLIKDGTYTVDGEQNYDPQSREWKSARWSVDVANELANAAGVTVAHAQGKMLVESKTLPDAAPVTGKRTARKKP